MQHPILGGLTIDTHESNFRKRQLAVSPSARGFSSSSPPLVTLVGSPLARFGGAFLTVAQAARLRSAGTQRRTLRREPIEVRRLSLPGCWPRKAKASS